MQNQIVISDSRKLSSSGLSAKAFTGKFFIAREKISPTIHKPSFASGLIFPFLRQWINLIDANPHFMLSRWIGLEIYDNRLSTWIQICRVEKELKTVGGS